MARDQDRSDGQCEWVNAWAAAHATSHAGRELVAAPVIAPITIPDDQLMRDITEIERVRDMLAAVPFSGTSSQRRTDAFTLAASRTSDSVPVVVGGVLALVMLTIFGAAAAMTKLSR